jgi:hypothetical protein
MGPEFYADRPDGNRRRGMTTDRPLMEISTHSTLSGTSTIVKGTYIPLYRFKLQEACSRSKCEFKARAEDLIAPTD